jgi:hypothetical protein
MADATVEERAEAARTLMAEGWTQDGAYNHLHGDCDAAICCGHFAGTDRLMLVCNDDCGEVFEDIQSANDHSLAEGHNEGFSIGYESDVM